MTHQPINPEFNDACVFIASKIFPLSFDVFRSAPNTYPDLHRSMDQLNRMAIWSGDHSNTCFADTETWWQFRAWHDWCHYRFGLDFTMPGEHAVCHVQAGQLMRLYGRGDNVQAMIALLFCNIVGQLEAGMAGQPVTDGHAYCSEKVGDWMPYAARIIAEQGTTDIDAMRYAQQAYRLRAAVGPAVPVQALPEGMAPAPQIEAFQPIPPMFHDGKPDYADQPALFA